MKLLFESWRRYLNEVKLSDVEASYTSKKTRNMIDRYASDDRTVIIMGMPRHFIELSDSLKSKLKSKWLRNFRQNMGEIISDEMPGGESNEALATLWVIKMAREHPRVAEDIIDGADASAEYWDIIKDFFRPEFQAHMPRPRQKDLMQYESLESLGNFILDIRRSPEFTEREVRRTGRAVIEGLELYKGDFLRGEEGKEITVRGKLRLIPDQDGWAIAAFKNFAAACMLSSGNWCTKHRKSEFETYNKSDDPLFYFENADGNKYQFHYGKMEFHDEDNEPVSSEIFNLLHNLLRGTEAPEKYPIIKNYDFIILGDEELFAQRYVEMTDNEVLNIANYLLREDIPWEEDMDKILSMLANDENAAIRSFVARNPRTPAEILQRFADEDENEGVRKWAAETLVHTGQL